MEPVRLQKYLAASGVTSRRKAEQFILDGRIAVNGVTVTTLGTKIVPGKESVTVDGKKISESTEKVYYLLNKPQGYVTTLSDPQGRPVVTELMSGVKERVFPVGRLDFNTEGALLMTNDGGLAQKVMHPSFETFKTYQAIIKGVPSKEKIALLEKGLMIDGKRTAPAKVNSITNRLPYCVATITIHEGRKHQVRIMFAKIGHPVTHLKRLAYGQLDVKSIKIGKYRQVTADEVKLIFSKG